MKIFKLLRISENVAILNNFGEFVTTVQKWSDMLPKAPMFSSLNTWTITNYFPVLHLLWVCLFVCFQFVLSGLVRISSY